MAIAIRPSTADVLERCASDLHAVVFDFREPARSVQFSERRIAEAERIASEIRAAVRGTGR